MYPTAATNFVVPLREQREFGDDLRVRFVLGVGTPSVEKLKTEIPCKKIYLNSLLVVTDRLGNASVTYNFGALRNLTITLCIRVTT